jgi:hypothetical protein
MLSALWSGSSTRTVRNRMKSTAMAAAAATSRHHHPDGKESIEELAEPAELIQRSVELMNTLRGDGWHVA